MILSEADAQDLTKKILGFSKAESCIVTIGGGEDRHVRFAQNMATTNGAPSSISVSVESHFGKRSGSATGTDLGDEALTALVASSENTAKLAPDNPEFMPPLGPQKYGTVAAFSAVTQATTSAQLAGGDSTGPSTGAGEEFAGLRFLGDRHVIFQLRHQQRALCLRPGDRRAAYDHGSHG